MGHVMAWDENRTKIGRTGQYPGPKGRRAGEEL